MNNVFQNIAELKKFLPQDKKITLVGGCFDLIHVGHVHLLKYTASLEDVLVVAVLSDSYARKYKNSSRPVINQKQRARMVASLRCVDFVYISDVSTSSIDTLEQLKPDSVVFSEEPINIYKMELRIKNIKIASPSTNIKLLPRYTEEEISTTYIIDKIRTMDVSE